MQNCDECGADIQAGYGCDCERRYCTECGADSQGYGCDC